MSSRKACVALAIVSALALSCGKGDGVAGPRDVFNLFAYVPNSGSGTISVYKTDFSRSILTAVQTASTSSELSGVTSVVTSRSSALLLAAYGSTSKLASYLIDRKTGMLSSASELAVGASPRMIALHPTLSIAYSISTGTNQVNAVQYSATGAMTVADTESTGSQPIALTLSPSGRHLFVANYAAPAGAGGLTVFPVAADGMLSAGTSFNTGVWPISVTVDAQEQIVFALSQGSAQIDAYAYDPATGALTGRATTAVGTQPSSIALAPGGDFAYVADAVAAGGVHALSINRSTRALTSLQTSATDGSSSFISVDSTGRAVLVTNGGGANSVTFFSRSSTTGLLTEKSSRASESSPAAISLVELERPR